MSYIPKSTIKRAIREASEASGMRMRVSDGASEEMIKLLESYINKVASTAARIANVSKRRTIRKEDIRASAEEIHGVIKI